MDKLIEYLVALEDYARNCLRIVPSRCECGFEYYVLRAGKGRCPKCGRKLCMKQEEVLGQAHE